MKRPQKPTPKYPPGVPPPCGSRRFTLLAVENSKSVMKKIRLFFRSAARLAVWVPKMDSVHIGSIESTGHETSTKTHTKVSARCNPSLWLPTFHVLNYRNP
uniref:Uncharacterized protein n=1 Tax=Cacopsylla melanoneura TaxID=428564 RepID=A0A8D8UMW0_9HEMI